MKYETKECDIYNAAEEIVENIYDYFDPNVNEDYIRESLNDLGYSEYTDEEVEDILVEVKDSLSGLQREQIDEDTQSLENDINDIIDRDDYRHLKNMDILSVLVKIANEYTQPSYYNNE